ncbi:site-specific DNA-methyltransferase [uncultured Mameliella sp.]|uniref:site-specific DNA-methyltransferase n=1 Tax=uncultured Mameliella sp. TaxID=1447087 RepID=UPI00261A0980|nr:site-specific DNA-methyltransferase [uncultured Mameliella sp.]
MTRDEDVRAAEKVPYRLLEEVAELGYGAQDAGNMLIQGDNLEALKALLPYFTDQVKCVYIDPPFNTGGAFPNYDDNVEHTLWLSLMYQRLVFLRDLLAEDGAIIVNLDDTQAAYAKVMMDEVFGRSNYIVTITVEAATPSSFKTVNTGPTEVSQFLLFYAKNKARFEFQPQYSYSNNVDLGHFSRFVVNFDDPPEAWSFKNIKQHVMDELEVPPADHPATRYKLAKEKLGEGFQEIITAKANAFALENAHRVFEPKTLQKPAKWLIPKIAESRNLEHPMELARDGYEPLILLKGRQMYFLSGSVRKKDNKNYISKPISTIWNDIPTNNLQNEGKVSFPSGKKPEMLLERVISMISKNEGDLVLDSFLGSGTTAAVAAKMRRRFIGIERGEQAVTHCAPRLSSVVDGETSGVSSSQAWEGGGGFRFYRLGPPVFTEDGQIQPDIRFPFLAAHIWFAETGAPWSEPQPLTSFMGAADGQGYALLYNGILGDKSASGGNVLTRKTLAAIRTAQGDFTGPLIVYGERTALSEATLKAEQIEFKQTPYDVKARK